MVNPAGLLTAAWPAGGIPIAPDRGQARSDARRELTDPAYNASEPSPIERGVRWLLERLGDLVDGTAGATPGGWWAAGALVLLAAALALGVRARVGPLRRGHARSEAVFTGVLRTAAAHRRAAEQAAAAGDLGEAVRERFRALARGLVERGVIDDRPGRTAEEVARVAAAAVPSAAMTLRGCARVFDDVHYGERPAGRDDYELVTAADTAAARATAADTAAARATAADTAAVDGAAARR